jgi:hypothetical protein
MAVNFSDILNTVVLGIDAAGNIIANTNPVSYTHAYDDVDLGLFNLKASALESTVAAGTPPLIVASSTVVTSFNADLVDGHNITVANIAPIGPGADDIWIDTNSPSTSINAYTLNGEHGSAYKAFSYFMS